MPTIPPPSSPAPRHDRPSSAYTRLCDLRDFDGCRSVAEWQQRHALETFGDWLVDGGTQSIAREAGVVNWSGCPFTFGTLEAYQWDDAYPSAPPRPLAALFALSILDRIDAPMHFLRTHAARLVPGGLLFCTFAYWDADGPDCAIGHEIRRRIYGRDSLRKLIDELRAIDIRVYGTIDWRYHGHTLGDHTWASLALTTERGR